VGTQLIAPLVVRVTDGFGNPIAGITVNWSVTGGGAVSAASTQTDVSGQTSVQRTLGPTAGPQTTSASAESLAGSPVVFNHTATAGSAARVIIVSGNGQQAPPGTQLPADLVVQVLDAENNPIVNRPVTWVVGTGDGSVNPETSNTDAEGKASAQWTLGPQPGRNTLSAVVSGVGFAAFNATATKASSSTSITAHQPEPSTIGQAVEVRVEVTGSGATPTGTVNVTGETAGSCTITLSNGAGACSLTFTANGQQRITATYSGDTRFNGSSDEENHQVNAANAAPTAAFTPPTCVAAQPCQFNDGSSDSDGNVVAWTWDFGDGQGSDQRNPQHTYSTPNTYNVKLTVRDDDGATNEVTHVVTVNAPPNNPPTAAADNYSTPAGQVLDVAVPGVLANDTDPENNSLTATLVTPPSLGLVLLDSDGSFQYFPGLVSGTVDSFTYTVSDGTSTSSPATVTITIQ
jgi:PKD repeat protein